MRERRDEFKLGNASPVCMVRLSDICSGERSIHRLPCKSSQHMTRKGPIHAANLPRYARCATRGGTAAMCSRHPESSGNSISCNVSSSPLRNQFPPQNTFGSKTQKQVIILIHKKTMCAPQKHERPVCLDLNVIMPHAGTCSMPVPGFYDRVIYSRGPCR